MRGPSALISDQAWSVDPSSDEVEIVGSARNIGSTDIVIYVGIVCYKKSGEVIENKFIWVDHPSTRTVTGVDANCLRCDGKDDWPAVSAGRHMYPIRMHLCEGVNAF